MTVSDFPLNHFFTNVQLAGIVVEGCLGERQDGQQLRFLSQHFFDSSIQRIVARFRFKDVVKLSPQPHLVLPAGGLFILVQLFIVGPQGIQKSIQGVSKFLG